MRSPIFPKWVNTARLVLVVLLLGGPLYAVVLFAYGASPKTLNVGYQPIQPVPYSHKLHAGELGLDCRYCHTTVEDSAFAAVPPASVCMNCHTGIRPDSNAIRPIRAAAEQGAPLEWVRVHDLPDFVYFDHSAHVTRGVGCVECHGRVDTMEKVHQVEPLSMAWCLECHRDPAPHLRPVDQVTNMVWTPEDGRTRRELGEELREKNQIHPPTDCSTCHR